ncbi:hypothetical protein [Kitasatospora sp. NPDC056184]|uniref:hypothetical protein n=1 Tax=Kitasatospora sp. NPDC056184 TaxID=3345738 RepID=UPI0035DB1B43
MTTTTPPTEPADPTETGGYCLACGHYGLGVYAGMRTAITDWITSHRGCTSPATAEPVAAERGPDTVLE